MVGEALPGMSAVLSTHKPGNSCGEQNGRLKPTCIKCADGRSPSVGAQAGGPSKALASFDRAVDHTITSHPSTPAGRLDIDLVQNGGDVDSSAEMSHAEHSAR